MTADKSPPLGEDVATPMAFRPAAIADRKKLADAIAAGEMEPTKKRTKYVCLDCGKSSRWTGDLGPDGCFDTYRSRFCWACGAQLVEDGPKRFIVEFESVSAILHPELYDFRTDRVRRGVNPSMVPDDWWDKQSRQDSEHGIRSQFEGLCTLMAEGELIRNVRVMEVPEQPVGVDVTASFQQHLPDGAPK